MNANCIACVIGGDCASPRQVICSGCSKCAVRRICRIRDRWKARQESRIDGCQLKQLRKLATSNGIILAQTAIDGLKQAFEKEEETTFENLSEQRKLVIRDIYLLLENLEKNVDLERAHLKADNVAIANTYTVPF